MFRHVCVVAWLLVAATGAAWAQADCAGPWLTQPQFNALPTAERTQEFQRLVDCSRKSVAEAQTLLGVLDAIKLDQYAVAIDAERQRLSDLLASRTAELNKAKDDIAGLVHQRDGLAQQLQKANDDLKRSEANKKDAWAKIDDLNQQIVVLTAERNKLATDLETSQAAKKAADDKAAGLAKEFADAQASNAALTKERDGLKDTVAADAAKIATLDAEVKRLGDQVDAETKALAIANDKNDYLTKDRDRVQGLLDAANKKIDGVNGTVEALTKENDDLKAQVADLTQKLGDANARIDALGKKLDAATAEIEALKKQVAELRNELDAANAAIDNLKKQAGDLAKERDDLKTQLDKANATIAMLQKENVDLTKERDDLKTALDAANVRIAELEKENADLKKQVDQFAKWRSVFFGKLRDLLGNQKDIEIVGDRFVLQSEVLFATGSAALSHDGHDDIVKVAGVIVELEKQIPADISWVLQVNGHTDTQKFRSAGRDNWDLSLARAMTVVRLLIAQGVDPHHLAAAGFGEFQPRDTGTTPEALAKNRRIELKLTDDGPLPPAK